MKNSALILKFSIILIVLALVFPLNALAQDGNPPPPPKTDVIEEAGVSSGESDSSANAPQSPDAINAPARAFSGGASYDSGWVSIGLDEAITLHHNLGGDTDNYIVDMQYRADSVDGVNLRYYGGADFGANPAPGHVENDRVGAYWRSLTDSSVTVYRRPEDTYAEQVRIRIWVESPVYTDYDSGWVALGAGAAATTLPHNLGGSVADYVVDMQYRAPVDGVNQRYYGGSDFGDLAFNGTAANERVGAYWRSLNTTNITVFRRDEDTYAAEVRVRIWVRPRATYDSGWRVINPDQAITLNHGIGGDPDDYQVVMDFYSVSNGINQRHLGGADFGSLSFSGTVNDDRVGAYWRTLTDNSITIYRRPEDSYAEQVRIRIFRYWQPTTPDYDSGLVGLGLDAAQTLNHNLGGSTNDYLVDMQYFNGTDGYNRRYYGGADFGDLAFSGSVPDDRVGAYWRSLTSSSITVYRRPEDTYAARLHVRIWVMPKPDYDSGWVALGAGAAATTLNHNLGGDYQGDYYVDMQYRSPGDGVNQRYFGGADFGAKAFSGTAEDDRVGAYWRSLTNSSITVYRRPNDPYAPEVRIRIWRMAAPSYDSQWDTLAQDTAQTFNHLLNTPQSGYLLQLSQWDTDIANTLNARHEGGADFGAFPPAGYFENDRVGTYWRNLNRNSVTVYRRPEDGFSDFIRLRIWDYNQTLYLPIVLNN